MYPAEGSLSIDRLACMYGMYIFDHVCILFR